MDALSWILVVVALLLVAVVVRVAYRNARRSPTRTIKGGPGSGAQAESGMGGGVPLPDHSPPRSSRNDQDRW